MLHVLDEAMSTVYESALTYAPKPRQLRLGLGVPHRMKVIGWHKAATFRRCQACGQPIPRGERYWGKANDPGSVRCEGCA
ncbi:MAG: hypothetical protein KGL39_12180 [Patescibacteria group bacterium]|nr:hypothetical protein [Patescibacteria group bacterium]